MSALVDQVAELHKAGVEIILVSSGAVASGRSEIHPAKKLDSVDQRQLFSAVGQAKLINRYYELFREHGIPVGQVLTMKENFATRRHYLNQKNCMTVMLENGVIPIVNENDTISVSELMFTDNDELSGLIASMMDAQVLIILSNIDGIYNGSLFPDVQSSALDSQLTYTSFIPAPQPVSSVKKWIAHSEGFAKGELHIDDCATKVLASDKAVSILPIGITDVRGEFEKDDIVRIIDFEGNPIGVGKANCSSEQAREAMGKHGKKPVVHYDYLYIE
jgi:glutamate 5-kinase